VGARVGDLLVLVGVVCVVLLARRNGKRNRVSAIANARAEAFAEGQAFAAANASNSTTVTVGQASAGGSGDDIRAVIVAILDELSASDGLRAVRDGTDYSGRRLGRVPELLLSGQDAGRDLPRPVAVGRANGRNGDTERVTQALAAGYDVVGGYAD